MNSRLVLLYIVFFISCTSNAQTGYNSEGLKVTRGDLEQNIYSKDSTANALVLYEIGNSYVDKNSFKLNSEIQRKIKIINKLGFEKATEIIYLYQGKKGKKEKVKNIQATVFNLENGEVKSSKLNTDDIIEEDYNENYKIVKFTLPNIKEGSVITYSYVLESPFMFKYKGWRFQENIPKLYSEYNASIPGNLNYNIKLISSKKLDINQSGTSVRCLKAGNAYSNCSLYKYAMKDIPAFIDENFMTTRENYLSRIEYELKSTTDFGGNIQNHTESWSDVDNKIKNTYDFGDQIKKLGVTRGLLDKSLTKGGQTLDRLKKIFQYVQENYTWNDSFELFHGVSLKNVVKEKSGSASEINLLLHNLLKDNDFNVKTLLLSTRSNGFVTQLFPIVSDFNYMVVHVEIDGKYYLLDATDKYSSFGQLPFRCLNHYGRLMDLNSSRNTWYKIDIKDISTQSFRGELNFTNESILNGTFEFKTTGYHALAPKRAFLDNTKFVEELSNKYPSIEFDSTVIKTVDKTDSQFNASFDIESETENTVGNITYLNPYLFPFFTENPFKLQERSFPVDFGYKDTYSYMVKLNIGSNYTIKEVPEIVNLTLPNNSGSLTSNYMVKDNTIIIIFKLTFNEPIYDSSYYPFLKKIMNTAISTQKNSVIVLEKKE